MDLNSAIDSYLEAKTAYDQADTRLKSCRERVELLLLASQLRNYECDSGKVSWVEPSQRATLDRAKLIQAGVTVEQIEKGTVTSPIKGHVKVERK